MILRRKKMKLNRDELIVAIHEIAEIIRMELPLRYQDKWLAKMVEQGLYHVEGEQ